MKRTISLILAILMIMTVLSGCGAAKTVPDQTIEWVISDYVERYSKGGNEKNYSAEVKHSPDKETKTDTVTVDLSVDLKHVTGKTQYTATYQYNKASDLWSVIRGGEWTALQFDRINMTDSSKLWLNTLREHGLEVELRDETDLRDIIPYIERYVFPEKYTSERYDEEYWEEFIEILDDRGLQAALEEKNFELVKDLWAISGWECNVVCFTLDSVEHAETAFDRLREEGLDYYSFTEGQGENYRYIRYYDNWGGGYMIRQDATLFSIEFDEDLYYDPGVLLEDLGFLPYFA